MRESEKIKMSNQTAEQLERVKNLLESNLEEMKKIHESELAMRELCAYELEKTKTDKK